MLGAGWASSDSECEGIEEGLQKDPPREGKSPDPEGRRECTGGWRSENRGGDLRWQVRVARTGGPRGAGLWALAAETASAGERWVGQPRASP